MTREEAELKVPDWIQGSLAPEAARVLEDLARTDPALSAYVRDVRLLYELEPDDVPPLGGREPLVLRRLRVERGLKRAGALAVAAGIVVLLVPWLAEWSGGTDSVPTDPLPFLPVELALDELPAYPEGWARSDEEALAAARLSGKPVLRVFVNPYCPRCQDVMRDLGPSPRSDVLDAVVLERIDVKGPPLPYPISEYAYPKVMVRMPALTLSHADQTLGPAWDLESADDLAETVDSWLGQLDVTSGLDGPAFEQAARLLETAARRAEQHEMAAACELLAEVSERARGTLFAERAAELREQIDAAIDAELARIRTLRARGGAEAEQARDLARRLEARVGDHPRRAELAALAR